MFCGVEVARSCSKQSRCPASEEAVAAPSLAPKEPLASTGPEVLCHLRVMLLDVRKSLLRKKCSARRTAHHIPDLTRIGSPVCV